MAGTDHSGTYHGGDWGGPIGAGRGGMRACGAGEASLR